jgi:calcium channel MID1
LCLLLAAPKAVLATTAPNEAAAVVEIVGGALDGVREAYEPEFGVFDRSIVGRAPTGVTALRNNVPESLNLSPGTTACYLVSKDTIFGGETPTRRQTDDTEENDETEGSEESKNSRKVYLSANTCLQPKSRQPDKPTAQPPQLVITISQSEDGGCARALSEVPENQKKRFEEGAVMFQANATGDLYVGIVAPEVDDSKFDEVYNFEVAASTDMYYHTYSASNSSELLWMDSDSSAVLLVTRDLTNDPKQFQKVMKAEPPYSLYAENEARNYTGGLRASVCGLKNNAQILANGKGDGMLNQLCRTGMTTRGPGGHPKQQFYFQGLNATSKYTGILYKPPTSTSKRDEDAAGGGGTIFPSISFQTVQGELLPDHP